MLTNLDIYYSAACNLQCEYCCMPQQSISNIAIVNALENGLFTKLINNYLPSSVISLGIWGMEPSINAVQFENFILPILRKNTQIKYIFLPTNLMSSDVLHYMIEPLNRFAAKEKRKLILNLQVSLDGPSLIHNKHVKRADSFLIVNNNLMEIGRAFNRHINRYFRVKVSNKSTLTAKDLYTNPDDWWFEMGEIQSDLDTLETYSFKSNFLNPPTIEVPGNYTKQDGQELVKWNLTFNTQNCYTCAAGDTSKTIDCLGNIWDCHMLVNKSGIDEKSIRNDFDRKMDKLLKEKEIIETNKEALWNAISSIYCWATGNNGVPESYIKLLGNGALQEV